MWYPKSTLPLVIFVVSVLGAVYAEDSECGQYIFSDTLILSDNDLNALNKQHSYYGYLSKYSQLNVTEAQYNEIKTVFSKLRQREKQLQSQFSYQIQKKMDQLMENEVFDEALAQILGKITAEYQAALVLVRMKARHTLWHMLTDTQKQQSISIKNKYLKCLQQAKGKQLNQ